MPEVGGILHCIAARIVVEVGEDVQSLSQVLIDLSSLPIALKTRNFLPAP
jgi:hypothetical protein